MYGLVVDQNIGVVHPMRTAYVRTIFRSVRIKIQTCAYRYAVKKISGTQTVFCFMRTQIKYI